ncbi:alpha-L-fucosidase 2-like [Chenopodium quinoa]|uniref:alpha-L-fucosidase 2-like n=1 Tax=Chenopodium quinoa TaxID=63459 RepID=UPI000B78D17A|nr:alpha-L-fucosidase 2-like [Chenopodium quinoa]
MDPFHFHSFLLLFLCFSLLFLGSFGTFLEHEKPKDGKFWKPTRRLSLENEEIRPFKIMFKDGARNWTDALPIGNGRLGAMIHGGILSEVINLNEDTLWTGIPRDYTNSSAPEALATVRKLVDKGNYSEATAVADKELSGEPSDVYQLLGDLKLDFHEHNSTHNYQRELDLNTATVTVNYSLGDVKFTREHFASNPDQVIVTKISSSKKGSLSFTVSLDSKMHHHSYTDDKNQIIMEGSCRGKRIPPKIYEVDDSPKGIQFCMVLNLQIGGDSGVIHNIEDQKFRVENADFAIVRLVASSSFDGPFTKPSDSLKNPTSEALTRMNSICNLSYSALYTRHLDDYQKLFHRVSLQLSKSSKTANKENEAVPTAERIRSFKTDEDPSLVELLFQYGRYLLISSSRPGTQPANLQGIWNKDIEPPWDGAPHTNINLQMNYWPSLPCNLHELQEPLIDFMSFLAANGKKTASINYEASGWVLHQVTDIWAKTSPDRGQAVWALWPMGGAWLSTHLWEQYTYTMDKNFLKTKAYPLLEGAASFLLDWWIEGKDGYLRSNPSTSPEHMFTAPNGKQASVSYSSTMDVAITKEVFAIIVSAAEELGRSGDDLIKKVLKAQARLPPYRIARDGTLMEWAQDFVDPDPHHRHVSHLFGIYPGHTITPEENPDLCKAANYSLYKRTEDGPGWSTVWKATLWANMRNSEHAYRMVKHLFNLVDPDREADFEGGLYSNLFSAHPPFQIDANFGFSAAVSEMLVQSTLKDLYLLPALPRDKWPTGCVKGLKARGGLTVNICWSEGELCEVGLWSDDTSSIKRLHYKGTTVTTQISPGKVYSFDRRLKCLSILSRK